LSKIASLAIFNWLSKRNVLASIKWPNDIYIENKKVAGILIEISIQGDSIFSAVVGIGLNLNQMEFSSNAPNPVSLKMITGVEYNITDAAGELRQIFMELYQQLKTGAYYEIDSAYFTNLFRSNTWEWYKEGERLHEARIVGIGEYGQLLLENRTGQINSYFFKEIQFVI
jgi:BirA family transcriptional regulator, biotin operon repressor / biotin---[acetyl-CoA-carboxylase] ligase